MKELMHYNIKFTVPDVPILTTIVMIGKIKSVTVGFADPTVRTSDHSVLFRGLRSDRKVTRNDTHRIAGHFSFSSNDYYKINTCYVFVLQTGKIDLISYI